MKRAAALALLAIAPAVFSGCSGSGPQQRTPENRLIVLGHSIGGIRLDEPRTTVEKALGRGRSRRRGLVWYFGGRLLVDYWFHGELTNRVEALETLTKKIWFELATVSRSPLSNARICTELSRTDIGR